MTYTPRKSLVEMFDSEEAKSETEESRDDEPNTEDKAFIKSSNEDTSDPEYQLTSESEFVSDEEIVERGARRSSRETRKLLLSEARKRAQRSNPKVYTPVYYESKDRLLEESRSVHLKEGPNM